MLYVKPKADDVKLNNILKDSQFDYRLAYVYGMKPTKSPADSQYHWGSKTPDGRWLKSPKHPTAWKEVFYETTGVNPDEIPMMGQSDADEILIKNGHKPTSEFLPKEWKPIKLNQEDEKRFRKWLKETEWFKEIK